MRVALFPKFSKQDKAEGGVRRVVEAQLKYLPALGVDFVDDIRQAEIVAVHAGEYFAQKHAPGVPRVFHNHGLYWAGYEWSPGIHNFNRGLIQNAHQSEAVTTPCEWVADIFRREMWLDPHVIYNGIEDFGDPLVSQGYVLWNKARVNSVCSPEPVNQLAALVPEIRFVSTFGEPASNVYLTGEKPFDQALEIVRHAGVYLSTTREVFSVGVLEALSSGVPVLGYDYGGNSEAVEHGKSGYLVPPGDIEALREGLEYCLQHRAMLSEGARERAKQFSWPRAMQQYFDLYQDLLKDQDRPRISVVIPCFNLGKYVKEAVASVQGQGLKDSEVEIIVVDDSSTQQETKDILAQLQGVTVYTTPQNLYLAHALNYGFARAHGRYFMSLDADNRLPLGTLPRLSAVLDAQIELDCVYGSIQFLREDGSLEENVGPNGIPNPSWPPASFDFAKQLQHENQAPSTSLFRRQLWERTGGYRQHALFGDDADLWTRAAALGFKFGRVTQQPTLQYRQRTDSMTTTSGPDVHYDWTRWTPKHRALMGVSHSPEIHPPKVSVVVNVKAGEGALARDAVESLWTQTFDDWEVIVHDCPEGVDFPPYVKWGTEPRGELILELSSWEWLEPDALELLVAAYERAPGEQKLVYTDYSLYDVGEKGPWHVRSPKVIPAGEETVGLIMRSTKEPLTAIHLPHPLVNRRAIEGGERTMACATCGNRGRSTVQRQSGSSGSARLRASIPAESEETVLVEFTGSGSRTVAVGGGVSYRFGEDPEHRQRRIRKSHASKFQNSSLYRLVDDQVVTPEPEPVEEKVVEPEPLVAAQVDEVDEVDAEKVDEDEDKPDAVKTPTRGRPSSR